MIKDYFAKNAGLNTCFIGEGFDDTDNLPDGVCLNRGFSFSDTASLELKRQEFQGIRTRVTTPGGYEIIIIVSHFTHQTGQEGIEVKEFQPE